MLTETLAYLDAGTGSLVVQTFIAGILTAGMYFRTHILALLKKHGN